MSIRFNSKSPEYGWLSNLSEGRFTLDDVRAERRALLPGPEVRRNRGRGTHPSGRLLAEGPKGGTRSVAGAPGRLGLSQGGRDATGGPGQA